MVVAGNQQEALAGAALPDSLAVKVTDAEGDPIPGQEVAFTLEKELPGADLAPGGGMVGVTEVRTEVTVAGMATTVATAITAGIEVKTTTERPPL